ncbi:glutamyl-tRNA reductase [Alicyclobacillus sp. SO9]|uniref:glutamyl-tRNA reductase n=1 Tax=Alicyclobacillus sp. SO9 TaxID=2665646 RepID=UPI0018E82CDF|nr:glutamyl-tRNA reductase [Alicyclobacillus sp. SO9]QQE77026.1 glutamyl-tRNA reductase [Alicyclobacillus sp. SO9]
MHIVALGLNQNTATVDVRERISLSDVDLDEVLEQIRNTSTVLESVVLSTCNRTEIYAVVSSYKAGEDYLKSLLTKRAGISRQELEQHLYVHRGEEAVVHLMKVISGMDSLIIGETQILGQVRNAYLLASDSGNTGLLLNRLFRLAIELGKKAQTETDIGKNPVSVSYAAVQLAKKIYGNLSGQRVLVVGAGKMSALAAQHLHANGVYDISVVNRTFEKAKELASQFQGTAYPWDELDKCLSEADIVISSTRSQSMVLAQHQVMSALKARSNRPMIVIDIAVPRDVDPAVGDLRNVYLYDIDDLQGVVAANVEERKRQSVIVDDMIQSVLREYSHWLSEQEVVPLITAIRDKGTRVQSEVMESLQRKLPDLSERELKLINKHTMSIVNQLLRDPVKNLKDLANTPGGTRQISVFAQLFGIASTDLLEAAKGNILAQSNTGDVRLTELAEPGFIDMLRKWRDSLLTEENGQGDELQLHPVLR